jgi:fatty-acyl-CoA synthase/long-chain acyl-CoA synthetase
MSRGRSRRAAISYVGQPDATAKALSSDGWLRTSDLGMLDARGYLRVTGRISDMVIRGGENIYPAEIEAVLVTHPEVAQVAVFGIPDAHWGEIVAAAILPGAGQIAPTREDLHASCRAALAPHKTPSRWFVAEAFPVTASGKIVKTALRDAVVDGRLKAL